MLILRVRSFVGEESLEQHQSLLRTLMRVNPAHLGLMTKPGQLTLRELARLTLGELDRDLQRHFSAQERRDLAIADGAERRALRAVTCREQPAHLVDETLSDHRVETRVDIFIELRARNFERNRKA